MSTLPAVSRDELVAAQFSLGMALNSILNAGLTARKPASEASELDTMKLRVPDGAPPVAAGPLVPDEQAARRSEPASTEATPIRRLRTGRERNDDVGT